ncbi:hypothetical protein [Streptomyces sp. NPDC048411]|uniref:hypothetical protein n=1 Tax=Streptomyces sp. NPDC048411 TaxID=3157206 RepID=UPI003452036D
MPDWEAQEIDEPSASCLMFVGIGGLERCLSSFVQQVLGWPAAQFGLTTAIMTTTAVAGTLLSQRVVTRLGLRRVAATGTVLPGCNCLLLTRLPAGGSMRLLPAALWAAADFHEALVEAAA